MGSADDRRFEVLRAIVADFVATQEPIGSKTLVERHNLGVSSATVRNDMAVLEAEGYITQPHTSSGRIPTEKGYREFVDRLDGIKPMSPPERRAILSFLDSGVDLDDVLRRAVRLLAQLTRQVAVVQIPHSRHKAYRFAGGSQGFQHELQLLGGAGNNHLIRRSSARMRGSRLILLQRQTGAAHHA